MTLEQRNRDKRGEEESQPCKPSQHPAIPSSGFICDSSRHAKHQSRTACRVRCSRTRATLRFASSSWSAVSSFFAAPRHCRHAEQHQRLPQWHHAALPRKSTTACRALNTARVPPGAAGSDRGSFPPMLHSLQTDAALLAADIPEGTKITDVLLFHVSQGPAHHLLYAPAQKPFQQPT